MDLKFFAYQREFRSNQIIPFNNDSIEIKDFDKLTNQLLIVPFTIIDEEKGRIFDGI